VIDDSDVSDHRSNDVPIRVVPDPSAVVAPAFAGLSVVAFSPFFYHPFFTLRAALLLVLLGPGLLALAIHARRDNAARAACALLAASAFSTAVASQPGASLWGAPNAGTGLVFIAASLGVWSLGRTISPLAMERCRGVLIAGISLNVVVAFLQRLDIAPEVLRLEGRPFGLTGNPVHLGALCAASVFLILAGPHRVVLWKAVALVVASAGVQVSGGRSALVLLVLAVAVTSWQRRPAPRSAAAVVLLAFVGVMATSAVGTGVTATAYAASGQTSSSVTLRLDAWSRGLTSLVNRPVVGVGPGQYLTAESPQRDAAAARDSGDSMWEDAHNFVVEFAVCTGVLGLAALALWSALASRNAAGPWAAFAATLALAALVEPMSLVTTPLLAFGLGVGAPLARAPAPAQGLRRVPLLVLCTAPGAIAAVALLVGEARLLGGSLDFAPLVVASADPLLPRSWPTVPLVLSKVETFHGVDDVAARRRAVEAAREATERAPADPRPWTRLGSLEGVWGEPAAASAAFSQALELNPWSPQALRGFAQTAFLADDEQLAANTCRKLRKVTLSGRCANLPLSDW